MPKFLIQGPNTLEGTIEIKGAKNAALKIMAASLLSEQKITIKNMPKIEDVSRLADILKDLGAKIQGSSPIMQIDPKEVKKSNINKRLMQKLRASIVLTGPLLARFGEVAFNVPGGDMIQATGRPINVFLDGFRAFGAQVKEEEDGQIIIKAKKLQGAEIFFPMVSVTGTECLMMAAALIPGKTVLKNAAMEPEVPALADYLNKHGALISGAGTSEITIEGVDRLSAGTFKVMPDRIDAGSFALMAVACLRQGYGRRACRGKVKINNCEPQHLQALWHQLKLIGATVRTGKTWAIVEPGRSLKAVNLTTHEYPGYATDLQAPYTVLMTQAKGSSLIHETIYDRRLLFTDILKKMGANINMSDPHRVIVTGPTKLQGAKISSPDIRAGLALVLAGLIAEGETEIGNIYQIDRGYEAIEKRLRKIGARIKRVK